MQILAENKAALRGRHEIEISLAEANAFNDNIAKFNEKEGALALAEQMTSPPLTPLTPDAEDIHADERDRQDQEEHASTGQSTSSSSSSSQVQPSRPIIMVPKAAVEKTFHDLRADAIYSKEMYYTLLKTCDDFGMKNFLHPAVQFFPDNYLEPYTKYRAPLFSDWQGGRLKVDDGSLGFTFEDRNIPALANVFLQAMQNRSKALLQFARDTGSAGCAYVSCGAQFPEHDDKRRNFLAICCPKCCSILYCSMACMARHANFHSAACTLFNGYGVAHRVDSRKRPRNHAQATDPRVQREDLTVPEVPAIPLKATVLHAVAVPAAAPMVEQVAIPVTVPVPPLPPVTNTSIAQAPVDFPTVVGVYVPVPNEALWTQANFSDKVYWTHPQVPGKYFFWQHKRKCYFVYQGSTLTRMDVAFRLYLISAEEDAAERAENAAANAKGGKGGKGGKGAKGKGGK